ncbi:MAG: AIPR family protein [Mollicutes bacterium PWAP]|nr:AIPR family protein [Mollicutes bacterium PWAP]
MTTKIKLKSDQFKKMIDPNGNNNSCIAYINVKELIKNKNHFNDWFSLNPRAQNLDTNVSKRILDSLKSNNNFHLLNRGILFSVNRVSYDNKINEVEFIFSDGELHGNIDGGHTLRTILELNSTEAKNVNNYVFIEFIEGIENKEDAIDLAEARNTSAAVDLKSIENLKGSFDEIKELMKNHDRFKDRIRYKMFEKPTDSNTVMIDVRALIALMNVFNDRIYDPNDSSDHPIQSYSGPAVSLRKFIDKYGKDNIDVRNDDLRSKVKIWDQLFMLWDDIELKINKFFNKINKKFASKHSFVDLKELKDVKAGKINLTKWGQKEIVDKVAGVKKTFKIPSGIVYPIISAFRVLLDEEKEFKDWYLNPIDVWKKIGTSLCMVVHNHLENSSRDPEIFAKNTAVWDSLYDKVKAYKQEKYIEKLEKINHNKFK